MLPLRYERAWLLAGFLMLVASLVVAMAPAGTTMLFDLNDKVLHTVAFIGLMVWFSGLFEVRYLLWLAAGLAGYGLLIEVLQSFTPTRQAEGLDLVADIVGILLGWLLSIAGLRRWCLVLESWFVRQKPRR